MGQKTNPNILRMGLIKNYNYKYLEKKSSELAKYDFNNLEIKKFVCQFFKNNKMNVDECKINYSQDGVLQIFISYYAVHELKPFIDYETETTELDVKKNNFYKKINVYNLFNHIKKQKIKKKKLLLLKKRLRHKYLSFLTLNNKFLFENYKTFKQLQSNYFLNLLCESLSKFLNKNLKIYLTLQQLNKNLVKKLDNKKIKFLKKSLVKLNRYQHKRNPFFTEGLNTLFVCSQKHNSANLISEFISTQLKNLKRHNFFLKFIKHCLTIFKTGSYSKLTGIKIKIKGRINRRPRAKHRFYKIGKEISLLSINSKVSYSEKTAFTPNGTMGVKVWTI
jgi:hypothetical protein